MECCGHQFSLAHQYWVTLAAGQDFDLRAGLRDAGRADENHLQWIAGQGSRRDEDGGVDLAAVGVAFDHCIEQAEGLLGGVSDLAGQEDASSAGAEDGVAGGVVAQAVEEVAVRSRNLSMVVDSPPGRMRPSSVSSSSGLRTSTGSAPAIR